MHRMQSEKLEPNLSFDQLVIWLGSDSHFRVPWSTRRLDWLRVRTAAASRVGSRRRAFG